MVTDYILNTLQESGKNITKKGPFTIKAGAVEHLKTEFVGDLGHKDWKAIIKALHPTPATCGLPKLAAKVLIKQTEKHSRRFYTGFLGPISQNKKSLFVNLRCMEIQNGHAYLYLGGGITAKSNAKSEWIETEKKALTLEYVLNKFKVDSSI
jgi:isochorismate synthase